mmetsp:Transcript_96487/g.191165  ORF Transcript_96487/g.191165 Transcript_96487/m.191165 type:complete len:310 (+) Transcript_96487:75-1004(+)
MAAAVAKVQEPEEAWSERIGRLQERFPEANQAQILEVLRSNFGHAGHAAADLRVLESGKMQEADPDDSEWVSMLLSNPNVFKETCKDRFQKFDSNRNGYLDWPEVVSLTASLSKKLGLEAPTEKCLRSFFFDTSDENKDGKLSEKEFTKFFESFLRYSFFMEHRRLVGNWRFQAGSDPTLGCCEFRVVQTKDWRMQFRCLSGNVPGGMSLPGSTTELFEVAGTLELFEGWLQADLKQGVRNADRKLSDSEPCGTIRLQLGDDTGDTIRCNFRSNPKTRWGKDISCHRDIGVVSPSRRRSGLCSRPETPL